MQDTFAHRHGPFVHSHPHARPHRHLWLPALARAADGGIVDGHRHERRHDHAHGHGPGEHGHTHGLVDDSIKRSRAGVRAVALSLALLASAAVIQAIIFAASGSIALLADVVHNGGDALTAVPLAIAFLLRSRRVEAYAGLAVVATILASAVVTGIEAVDRLLNPSTPTHLVALVAAGVIGFFANRLAAEIRTTAGRRLDSPALIADGNHARADAYVSLSVIASATFIGIGAPIVDPLIGLVITLVILRITWSSWLTVKGEVTHRPNRHRPQK